MASTAVDIAGHAHTSPDGRPAPASRRKQRIAALAGLTALLLGLPGCQSIAVNAGNVATLRVIQASPDAPAIDFVENGTAFLYNFGFSTVTTTPIVFSPGTYNIAAVQHATSTVLASSNVSMANMHAYTALLVNVNASLQETILPDQNTPAPSSQISVRVLDETTRINTGVDVYLVPNNGKISTSTPIATGLTFGSNTGYINVPAGTYAIAVVPTGTVPSSSTGTLLTGPQTTYSQGAVRTFVLVDQQIVTSQPVQALALADFDYNGTTT